MLEHQAPRLQLEKNVIMYQNTINEYFKEAFPQQTLVALIRAGMCEVHHIILSEWARKHMHYMGNLA